MTETKQLNKEINGWGYIRRGVFLLGEYHIASLIVLHQNP